MKKLLALVVLILAALPAVAGAGEEVKTGTLGGKPYFEASEKTTEQATVIKVEKTTRLVTMKDEHGDTLSITAGDEVKNFAQIKVGDVVKVTYTEQLTVHVEAPGPPEMTSEKTTGAAKPGEKPAGSMTEQTKYKANITAIDKKNGTATLKGYDGEEFVITPLHPENLDKVKLGELVVFTHTQAVAVKVEKVAKKK